MHETKIIGSKEIEDKKYGYNVEIYQLEEGKEAKQTTEKVVLTNKGGINKAIGIKIKTQGVFYFSGLSEFEIRICQEGTSEEIYQLYEIDTWEEFRIENRRYIKDVYAKKEYEEENRKNNSAFGELFNMFFGNVENSKEKNKTKVEKTPIKGENIETSIDVNIEEVFYGLDKKISLRAVDGKMKVFTVSIPAGIRNGEKIRLLGQGKEGIDGGKNGDLFIKVNIKDSEKFKLKGNDLYTNLYLTPWEAALGTRTTIYSIDEGTQIYIPGGIGSGEILRVAGKGYKDGKGSRGDLIAKVNIMVPKELSKEEKSLFEKLSIVSNFNPRKY
mgnify:CR=1 FL=1